MTVCVECGASAPQLFVEFTKGNVKLIRCKHCSQICDKYVEYDVVILLLDLILLQKQVYRHLIFNFYEPEERNRALTTCMFTFVWCLVVDSVWMYRNTPTGTCSFDLSHFVILFCCLIESVFRASVVITLVQIFRKESSIRSKCYKYQTTSHKRSDQTERPQEKPPLVLHRKTLPRGDVFAVLVASSFGKLFLILNVLWHFDMHFYALVEVFTLFSNVVALEAALNTSFLRSFVFVASAYAFNVGVHWFCMRLHSSICEVSY